MTNPNVGPQMIAEMTLKITISPDAEAKLREKAAAAGQDISAYVAGVLERTAKRPLSIEEISGPIAEEFRKSEMTEDALTELLEDAKHHMRREKRS